MPTYEVEQVDAPRLEGVQLDMRALAQLEGAGFEAALRPLADAYESWIARQAARPSPAEPDLAAFPQSVQAALDACRRALGRIREGIHLLQTDLYGAKILSIVRNRGWRLPEIIVDDASQNILPTNQTFCTLLRA